MASVVIRTGWGRGARFLASCVLGRVYAACEWAGDETKAVRFPATAGGWLLVGQALTMLGPEANAYSAMHTAPPNLDMKKDEGGIWLSAL